MPHFHVTTPRSLAPPVLHAFVVITLVVGLLLIFLLFSHRSTTTAIEARASQEAQLLAMKLEDSLRRADMTLSFIRDRHLNATQHAAAEPTAADAGGADLHRDLVQLARSFPEALAIIVTDAEGRVRAATLGALPAWHVGDRDYFQRARSSPSDPTLTPPSHTPRHKARSARRPTKGRKGSCIYVGAALNRA